MAVIRSSSSWHPLRVASIVLLVFALGYLTHRHDLIPYPIRHAVNQWSKQLSALPIAESAKTQPAPGTWFLPRDHTLHHDDPDVLALSSLGYLSGETDAPALRNVTYYDAGAAHQGLNFYVSGHAPEAVLIDMHGEEWHRWRHDFWNTWPEFKLTKTYSGLGYDHFRRAHLFPNGDILAIHSGVGIVKLDKDSHVIWAQRAGYHHDLEVLPSGEIYILDAEIKRIPRIHKKHDVVEDFIAILEPDGAMRHRVSILECFERSAYAPVLDKMPYYGDLFHTNTIEVLDGKHSDRSPIFRAGNILISIFKLNTIAIIDLDREEVVWAMAGQWVRQHQPSLLDNGNILIFDNAGHGGTSKVLEFDPFTQATVWSYADSPETPFYSKLCGSSQRLPNGNTLITESTQGRAIEVTSDKRTVWEFYSPYRAGEQNELIANLFELIRIDPDYVSDWLNEQYADAGKQP